MWKHTTTEVAGRSWKAKDEDLLTFKVNSSIKYLEKPIVSFTPIIPRVWQRSVDRDLVADVLVESIVLQLWFSKEKKGVVISSHRRAIYGKRSGSSSQEL